MQRRIELDALRGFMLVWITLTHLPTFLSTYVNQPFGYLSASEGFIFLSALFTGLIYYRSMTRDGFRAMRRKLWSRTARLYGYHAFLLLLLFVVQARVAMHGNRPAVHNLLDFYFTAGPKPAVLYSALLLYCPPLLDILPIYIVFLAITPLVLLAAARVGWKPVLGGSFAIWLLAQIGIREFVYHLAILLLGLHIPLHQMGPFDYWAWQFWWVVGVWLGVNWARNNELSLEVWAQRFLVPAVVVAVALLALRYTQSSGLIEFGRLSFLVDKWHFGLLRLVDSAAVAVLAIRYQTFLKSLAVRPLVMLGQASLQVFCVHLVFVFIALSLLGANPVMTGWQVPLMVGVSLAGLMVTARIAAANRAGRKRNQPPGPGIRKEPQMVPAFSRSGRMLPAA